MFAGGDEDLLAGNLIAAVALRNRLGAQQAEIGAAMGFCEVHGAGPGAFDHLRQIGFLLLLRAMHENGGNRTLREARIHHQRQVGRRHIFADSCMQRIGQALPAELRRNGKADPAAFTIGVISVLETIGHGDRTVIGALAALAVAGKVEREKPLLGKLCGLAGDRLDHVGGCILKAGQVVIPLQAENVVQDKKRVFNWGLVNRHYRCSSASWAPAIIRPIWDDNI
ncbi:hypothetical protein D3C80_284830 [compost metagenome]